MMGGAAAYAGPHAMPHDTTVITASDAKLERVRSDIEFLIWSEKNGDRPRYLDLLPALTFGGPNGGQ
jgi:hypothetical protein